jgi:ABC-type xylose transport system permease subunit
VRVGRADVRACLQLPGSVAVGVAVVLGLRGRRDRIAMSLQVQKVIFEIIKFMITKLCFCNHKFYDFKTVFLC